MSELQRPDPDFYIGSTGWRRVSRTEYLARELLQEGGHMSDIDKLWQAIGTYSAQVATTGELAPSAELVTAVTAVKRRLATATELLREMKKDLKFAGWADGVGVLSDVDAFLAGEQTGESK